MFRPAALPVCVHKRSSVGLRISTKSPGKIHISWRVTDVNFVYKDAVFCCLFQGNFHRSASGENNLQMYRAGTSFMVKTFTTYIQAYMQTCMHTCVRTYILLQPALAPSMSRVKSYYTSGQMQQKAQNLGLDKHSLPLIHNFNDNTKERTRQGRLKYN